MWPDEAENFSRETHISDLVGVIEALGAGPVHLVGFSYGGEIALFPALNRPDLVRSMVLYEPNLDAVLDGVPGSAIANAEMGRHFGAAVAALKAGRLEDAALAFVDGVFKQPAGWAAEKPAAQMWRENGRTLPPYVAMNPGAPVSCSDLSTLRQPALVVQGERSFAADGMISGRVADCLANALLITMEGVSHDGPFTKPAELGSLIVSFLDVAE